MEPRSAASASPGSPTAATEWHERAWTVEAEWTGPAARAVQGAGEGAGHSFGVTAVRGFGDMTEERPAFGRESDPEALRLLTLGQLDDAFGLTDDRVPEHRVRRAQRRRDRRFGITAGYRDFVRTMHEERSRRPAALRDVLALPADVTGLRTPEDFARELGRFSTTGNASVTVRGVVASVVDPSTVRLRLTSPGPDGAERHAALADGLALAHPGEIETVDVGADGVDVTATGTAARLLALLDGAPGSVPLSDVQPATRSPARWPPAR